MLHLGPAAWHAVVQTGQAIQAFKLKHDMAHQAYQAIQTIRKLRTIFRDM